MESRAPPGGYTTYQNCPLPTPEDRLLFILVYLKTTRCKWCRGGCSGWPEQGPSVDSRALGGPARDAARAGGCPHPVPDRVGEAPRGDRADAAAMVMPTEGPPSASDPPAGALGPAPASPLLATMGPNGASSAPRTRLSRPRHYSGKKNYHTVKNVLLINAALTILFLSDTYAGSTHDKRIADTTPYPLPAGSRLLQDLGFLAFTLDHVDIIMPTRKPRGRALTRAQKAANRRIARRRVRIEHVNSRGQALSHRPRHLPPPEGGRPRCGHGSLLWRCITFGCVWRHGNRWLIGMNSIDHAVCDTALPLHVHSRVVGRPCPLSGRDKRKSSKACSWRDTYP